MRTVVGIGGLAIFLAMAVPIAKGRLLPFDLPIRDAIHPWASPALTVAMRAVTVIGSGWFLVPLGALLAALFAKRGKGPAVRRFVGLSLGAQLFSELLKGLFHRHRPDIFFGLTQSTNGSFPSGHSLVPLVVFWLLADVADAGPAWRVASVSMAVVLGFTRVYLGYHYPSDVIGGWALAAIWLALWDDPE